MRQAAEQVGVSRQTMFRHIKEGRVSATLSHSGEKQIEVTELLRAFGALQTATVTLDTPQDRPRQPQRDSFTAATVTYQIEIERLKAQLTLKTSELELAKERITEIKEREHEAVVERNRLLTLIEQQTRLLAAPVSGARATAPTKKTSSAITPQRTIVKTKPKLVDEKTASQTTKNESKPKKVASSKTKDLLKKKNTKKSTKS